MEDVFHQRPDFIIERVAAGGGQRPSHKGTLTELLVACFLIDMGESDVFVDVEMGDDREGDGTRQEGGIGDVDGGGEYQTFIKLLVAPMPLGGEAEVLEQGGHQFVMRLVELFKMTVIGSVELRKGGLADKIFDALGGILFTEHEVLRFCGIDALARVFLGAEDERGVVHAAVQLAEQREIHLVAGGIGIALPQIRQHPLVVAIDLCDGVMETGIGEVFHERTDSFKCSAEIMTDQTELGSVDGVLVHRMWFSAHAPFHVAGAVDVFLAGLSGMIKGLFGY